MADALLLNTFQKISPAYELVADVTVGTATTQVDFSGLNFGKDDDLLLVSNFKSSTSNPFVYFNDNTTPTNYYCQRISADNTTVGGVRANISFLGTVDANQFSLINTNIKLTNGGYLVWQSHENRSYDITTMTNQIIYGTSTFTSTSITKISINAGTNGIGIGSRFQLYRLKAKKVADIIVSSATTQVDITSLNLDKDSEYMLVSDIVSNANSNTLSLFANNNTTPTNYYSQELGANGTGVNGSRANTAIMSYCGIVGDKTLVISNIKLTNNGYFISQNKGAKGYGTSGILLDNFYETSTFTTTNITQLSINSNVSNGIGGGSRFTLYRLDDGVATPDSSIRKVGNLVYMTSNSAPSPYVATVSPTPTSNSAYMAFDATNSTGPTWNYITTVAWAKMIWTAPIRIKEMVVRANRSGQANTAIRVYGIKADASEISLYNASPSSNTDITITPSDTTTPFVGVRMEIDGRSDLIISILNCRITQWYTT